MSIKYIKMKLAISMAFIHLSSICTAQELFSTTEPASNRAARSIGLRIDNLMMEEINTSKINYHLIPEIMMGISKNWMINGNIFFSNRSEALKYEGGSIYTKYRFLSNDGVQRHFRMAGFGRISVNNSDIHQEEISLNGHNTGMEVGIVATKLIQKVALSSSVSFLKATDNGNNNKFIYGLKDSKAVDYSFSIGKLMLPKEYKVYTQTNINCMLEFLNQVNIAATLQMIFNSQSRVDIGYKRELKSTMTRTAPNGFFIRLETNFFNAFLIYFLSNHTLIEITFSI